LQSGPDQAPHDIVRVSKSDPTTALISFPFSDTSSPGPEGLALDLGVTAGKPAIWSNQFGSPNRLKLWEIGPSLAFPLKGTTPNVDEELNPETAIINSVFDHSMKTQKGTFKPYGCDFIVQTYTGELGNKHGSGLHPKDSPEYFKLGCEQGYAQDDAHTPFLINGHYEGGGDPTHLYYDGHPGIDYRAAERTQVYAAASGIVRYPRNIVGVGGGAYNKYHVLELIPDGFPDYRIYYLHLSTHPSCLNAPKVLKGCADNELVEATDPTPRPGCDAVVNLPLDPPGTHVKAGCLIALSGQAGSPGSPHLHLEVHKVIPKGLVPKEVGAIAKCIVDKDIPEDKGLQGKACVSVDPYGWKGSTDDPYEELTRVKNLRLWSD